MKKIPIFINADILNTFSYYDFKDCFDVDGNTPVYQYEISNKNVVYSVD